MLIPHLSRIAISALMVSSLLAPASVWAADPEGESPGVAHTYFMRGQILDIKDETVVLCIGKSDGAVVGQELDVIRHRRVSSGPKGQGRFERETIGRVRVTAIIDDHYAEGALLSGSASGNDSVELIRE